MKQLINMYGEGSKWTVRCDGVTLSGTMYGNDECIECGKFYQILVADNRIYYCYYDTSNLEAYDLDTIDYSAPYEIIDVTDRYDIDEE